MKKIRTKGYIKSAFADNYPPGVTGNESYFQDSPEPELGKNTDTIPLKRDWDAYGKWYNSVEEFPVKMPQIGISNIDVTVSYQYTSNQNVDVTIKVLGIKDSSGQDITQFGLTDVEEDNIKNEIANSIETSQPRMPDTRREQRGEA